jgi:hypothetical protein
MGEKMFNMAIMAKGAHQPWLPGRGLREGMYSIEYSTVRMGAPSGVHDRPEGLAARGQCAALPPGYA